MFFNPFEQGLTVSEIAKECKTAEGGRSEVYSVGWGWEEALSYGPTP